MTPSPSISNLARLAKEAAERPYVVGERDPHRCYDKHGHVVAEAFSVPSLDGRSLRQRANDQARFIVSCANSHDALLEVAMAAAAWKDALMAGEEIDGSNPQAAEAFQLLMEQASEKLANTVIAFESALERHEVK